MKSFVYLVGIVLKQPNAPLEAFFALACLGKFEHIPAFQIPVPPAQPVQALLLFLQLRQRELADPYLFGDLFLELDTVRPELRPLINAKDLERRPKGILAASAFS